MFCDAFHRCLLKDKKKREQEQFKCHCSANFLNTALRQSDKIDLKKPSLSCSTFTECGYYIKGLISVYKIIINLVDCTVEIKK